MKRTTSIYAALVIGSLLMMTTESSAPDAPSG